MNIFLRELKAHRTGTIWWSVGIVSLIAAGMAKYAAYQAAGQSVTDMLSSLPRTVQVVFGLTGFDLATASGFYGVLFLYIAVMAAVHASLLGANLISKEERDRTSEFLYAKPISRGRALTAKLLAGLTMIVILNLVTYVSSIYSVNYLGNGTGADSDILLLTVGLLFLQLMFFAIGALVAGLVRKPKAAPSLATSIMFVTFMVFYLVNLDASLDFLKYLTPFKYFDAAALMATGQFDPVFVVLAVAIIGLSIFGTYRFYSARDLTV